MNNVGLSKVYELPAHGLIPEVPLKFHPLREEDTDEHPLRGLSRYGPYSRSILGAVNDPIRIALIAPHDAVATVQSLLAEIEQSHQPKERLVYLVDFKGFSSTFGTRVVLSNSAQLLLPPITDQEIASAKIPHQVLAERLTQAINVIQTHRSDFDVLLIFLPERWNLCFTHDTDNAFDLHDYLKSHTASVGVPTQIIRADRTLTYHDRCSVMWRLAIALYCKAGGIPWKLAQTEPDTAYIGLAYAIKYNEKREPTFLTTCSQVFDHDGTGLEFLAYETRDMKIEGDNPYLSRSEMYRVMIRSLTLYQHRHAGRLPNSVVVHKVNPYKSEEIDGCFDAFRTIGNVELIQIQKDTLWRGAHLDPPVIPEREKSRPGYACLRGSYLLLGDREALLWTQGNVPQTNGKNFFKEMKGTPNPLLIRRFAGHGPFNEPCRMILGLTKMDWNNDALYDRLPVTLSFASRLAQVLKRMPTLLSKPYPYRLFM